jgi:hypothetical protein
MRSSILDPLSSDTPSSVVGRSSGLNIKGAQTAGRDAGAWCAYGLPGDFPPDQRAEDGLSLCFTSAPLEAPLEILGFPELTITVAADQPLALLAVRLCDVAPTGDSLLVSRGLLNLTHRASHEHPTPLEPGERYTVTVRLNAIAHRLPAGHCWRVAVSPTYWPHAWPSPTPVTLSVFVGGSSRLDLPVRPPRADDADLAPFGPPEHAAPLAADVLRVPSRARIARHDAIRGSYEIVDQQDGGHRRFVASRLEYDYRHTDTYTICDGDPLSASQRCDWTIAIGRGEWRTRVETTSTMTADAASFHVTNTLDAYEGNTRVFAKTWSCVVPRDLV